MAVAFGPPRVLPKGGVRMSPDTQAAGVARDQLRAFVERIERTEEEIATLNADKSDIYKEARAVGFDVKVLRKVVAKRKLETHVREEQDAIFDMYWEALYGAPVHVHTHARENIEEFDAETGEILDDRRSDNGLNILTKHEDIRTAPETAPEFLAKASGDNGATEQDIEDTADSVTGDASRSSRGDDSPATNSGKATVATQGEATAPNSDDGPKNSAAANAGGDDVNGGAERATHLVTGEGTACALPDTGVTLEHVPASGVKRLPFAHCFPELSKAEYERLEKDIAANRVRVPIIRQGDMIVDGWARYLISRQYGMSYPVSEYRGTDVLLDVIDWQRAARNFTSAQEKKIAADLAKEIPHRADEIMAAFGLADALDAAE